MSFYAALMLFVNAHFDAGVAKIIYVIVMRTVESFTNRSKYFLYNANQFRYQQLFMHKIF